MEGKQQNVCFVYNNVLELFTLRGIRLLAAQLVDFLRKVFPLAPEDLEELALYFLQAGNTVVHTLSFLRPALQQFYNYIYSEQHNYYNVT